MRPLRTDYGLVSTEGRHTPLFSRQPDWFFDSLTEFLASAEADFYRVKGLPAIRGDRVELREHDGQIVAKIPSENTYANITEWAAVQMALMVDFPLKSLNKLSPDVAVKVLRDRYEQSFSTQDGDEDPRDRFFLPQVWDYGPDKLPWLKSLRSASFNVLYDHELYSSLTEYMGKLDVLRSSRGERDANVWYVNRDVIEQFEDEMISPALLVRNSETGQRGPVICRAIYMHYSGRYMFTRLKGWRKELFQAHHWKAMRNFAQSARAAVSYLRDQAGLAEELAGLKYAVNHEWPELAPLLDRQAPHWHGDFVLNREEQAVLTGLDVVNPWTCAHAVWKICRDDPSEYRRIKALRTLAVMMDRRRGLK